jgi:hypothetical protein
VSTALERLPARALLAGTALLMLAGCADTTYNQLGLGQERRDFDRIMPRDSTRSTDLGMAYLAHDSGRGRTDAIVVLLTRDRRIAAKIQASYFERNLLVRVDKGFLLRGEVDPRLAELDASGPIDTLRVIVIDLLDYQGERLATEAHALVAAGLVRLMQAWPNVSDIGIDTTRLNELFERVPGGGTANIAVREDGVYRFEYRQGATP